MGKARRDPGLPARRLRTAAGALAAAGLLAAGAGEAQAAVECGDTITQDRKLTKDLIDCPATGLVIGAPGVTLDLNGHRLDGAPGSGNDGILNSGGHDDVVIKGGGGGTITQFARGVEMNNTQDSRINGITFKRIESAASSVGIFLNDSTEVVVKNNSLSDTDEDQATGILLQGTTGVELVGNSVRSMLGEDSVGIQVSLDSQNSVIDRNVVDTIRGIAVLVDDSDGTRLLRNRVVRGRDRGMQIVEDSDSTVVKRNTLLKSEDGVLVLGSTTGVGTRIIGNTARRNEEDGIEVDIVDARIGRNLVVDNADWGIEANAGVTDLGGNRAAGNGEAQQCLNVVCTPP